MSGSWIHYPVPYQINYTIAKRLFCSGSQGWHEVLLIVIVISRFLKHYFKAKCTRAPAYSRALWQIKGGLPKGVKGSSGPSSRIPGGDRVAVKVGVVQVEKVNDQMGQSRSVSRDDISCEVRDHMRLIEITIDYESIRELRLDYEII